MDRGGRGSRGKSVATHQAPAAAAEVIMHPPDGRFFFCFRHICVPLLKLANALNFSPRIFCFFYIRTTRSAVPSSTYIFVWFSKKFILLCMLYLFSHAFHDLCYVNLCMGRSRIHNLVSKKSIYYLAEHVSSFCVLA
jgi:hypothetical protein